MPKPRNVDKSGTQRGQAFIIPFSQMPREPTIADTKDPRTGRRFELGHLWLIKKDPQNGFEGDLWYLAHFELNGDANWRLMSFGGGNATSLEIAGGIVINPNVLGRILVTTEEGTLAISNDPNNLILDLVIPVKEIHGGTGQTTYTTGDILFASDTNELSKLPAGSDGQVLTLDSGIPSWQEGGGGGGAVQNVFVDQTSDDSDTGLLRNVVGDDTTILLSNRITTHIQTTTDQLTNLLLFPLDETPTAYKFQGETIAFNETSNVAAGFSFKGSARTDGTTAFEISQETQGDFSEGIMSDIQLTLSVQANNVVINIEPVGLNGETINWNTLLTYRKVGAS